MTNRIPRPLGTTYTAILIRNNQDNETKQKQIERLRQITIDHWMASNMILNNRVYNIDEMALYLGITPELLMRTMNKQFEAMGKVLERQDLSQIARVIFSKSQKNCLEIEALARAQTNILLASQGGEYKPFISAEVNRSISNMISSTKPQQDLLRLILDSGKGNPLSREASNNGGSSNSIGKDEALQIIQENTQSLLLNDSALEAKYAEIRNDMEANNLLLPDVNARTQDLSKIGIKIKPTQLTTNPNGPTSSDNGPSESHINRANKAHHSVIEDIDSDDFIS